MKSFFFPGWATIGFCIMTSTAIHLHFYGTAAFAGGAFLCCLAESVVYYWRDNK